MNVLISKSRRPKFSLALTIHDLSNIPLLSGCVYVKWHIKDSTSGDSRGRTEKVSIKDHKAVWNYVREIEAVRMVIRKDGRLSNRYIVFEVVSEMAGEKIDLGNIHVNMAEFAKEKSDGRRYLLQNSKVNSTLKISMKFHQLSGDSTFSTPSISNSQVFGGLRGVIVEKQKDKDDTIHIPSSLDIAEQSTPSLYRETLTASWLRQDGELPAEECIEDIFGGGDGWAKDPDGRSRYKPRTSNSDTANQRAGLVPRAGVSVKKKNGEILGWSERSDLRSWKLHVQTEVR
ncbi:N-terminal C2 in EEIG1 and EHBP1 proteins-domain-containing protein [Dipodascopsis uninucleata]